MDNDYEILAVEAIGKDPKYKWEIIGIYRAANEDMRAIEKLLGHTSPTRNLTRRSIIRGDLNLPHADWSGDVGKESGVQALVNNLIWDNGHTQVVCKPTRGGSLLDIYLLRPGNALISCNVLPGISDHEGVLLEVQWSDKCRDDNAGRIVPMYHKTNVLGMQTFL